MQKVPTSASGPNLTRSHNRLLHKPNTSHLASVFHLLLSRDATSVSPRFDRRSYDWLGSCRNFFARFWKTILALSITARCPSPAGWHDVQLPIALRPSTRQEMKTELNLLYPMITEICSLAAGFSSNKIQIGFHSLHKAVLTRSMSGVWHVPNRLGPLYSFLAYLD